MDESLLDLLQIAVLLIEDAHPPKGSLAERWRALRATFFDRVKELPKRRIYTFAIAHRPLQGPTYCDDHVWRWLWPALRRAFPEALAACILPDRILLVTPSAFTPIERLNRLLGQLARTLNARRMRETTSEDFSADLNRITAMVRETSLAPCEDRLATDPLEWPLSTYRGLMGAVAHPWVSSKRLAKTIQIDPHDTRRSWHEHVCESEPLLPRGSPLPSPAQATGLPSYPLGQIMEAACSATLHTPEALKHDSLTRRIFVHLAMDFGWREKARLAELCGCTIRTITRVLDRRPDEETEMMPARLCLGDDRLRRWSPST